MIDVRDISKIKASWDQDAGQRERDKGPYWGGCPQPFLVSLCYNYYRNRNHYEVRFALKTARKASMQLPSFQ